MSQRYIGSLISPTAAPTNSVSTTGVWSINDQYQAKNAGNWPLYSATDPYFQYVSLLLPGNGTNGAQNNTFIDSSTNNFTITRNGNATQGTFSPYYSCWSNYFDGAGDYLTMPYNAGLTLNSGNFTIEFFVYPLAFNTNNYVLMQDDGTNAGQNFQLRYNSLGNIEYLFWSSGASRATAVTLTSSSALVKSTWNHVAVTYTLSNTTTRVFINGALVASSTTAPWNGSSYAGQTVIGNYTNGSTNQTAGNATVNAYLSNLRMIKGTALYTATFTPSTAPFTAINGTALLTCQSNRLMDNSPNNITLTKVGDTSVQKFSPFESVTVTPYYSGNFNGTSDYLSVASNAAFQLGTGDYTFEAWIYPTSLGVNNTNNIINIGTYLTGLMIRSNGTTTGLQVYTNGTSRLATTTGLTANAWQHIALVRSGTACTLYINGAVNGTFTDSSSISPATATVTIGMAAHNSSEFFTGNISNFRLVKGAAVYTSTFTPSTTPLTEISGTSLLTCQSSTFIDNSTNAFSITVGSTAKPLATSPFTPTTSSITSYSAATNGGSVYFDGSGDYLNLATNAAFGLGTGDFTIEFWTYSKASTRQDWIDITNGSQRLIVYYNGTAIAFYSIPPSSAVITGPALTLNAWTHIAVTKQSGSSKLFVNGVQVGSTYATSQDYGTSSTLTIGKDNAGSTYATGFMSNIRIVKGTAVYTSNFVPPSSPVTGIVNTSILVNATNAGIIDNASINDLETAGNAQISTAQSKFGGSSMYFDGTGDYLSFAQNNTLNFGSNNFTVECWIYVTSSANSDQTIIASNQSWGAGAVVLKAYHGGNISFTAYDNSSGGTAMLSYACTLNTWIHVALVRVGTAFTLYIDGVSRSTATSSINVNFAPTGGTYIGYDGPINPTTGYLYGYIDDLRVTNGYARYTGNFTPPTSAFPIS